jgi:DNA-directed RNA polymerase subunit RPC12/RpoP
MKRIGNPTDLFSDRPNGSDVYKEFDATELYCPRCKQPVPVRKRLLLVLPEGDKYEYLCAYCSETVGTKMDKKDKPLSIIT